MEALVQAVGKGEEGTIMRLLDEDPALLEGSDQTGHIPLTTAAAHGRLKVAKLLLQRGAAVNATGRCDATALYWAAERGHEEMAIFLLSNGADTNRRDMYGRLPLLVACWKGHLGVVRVLVQHVGDVVLQATDDEGKTALHWAAFGGREEMATFLLSNGADATRRDTYGRVPLIVACWKGHLAVVRVLLQHTGAEDLETMDKDGKTALYWAATDGHEEVVAFLLESGAHVNRLGYCRKTPLMEACDRGHMGVVRVFLQHFGGALSSVARGQGLEEADLCGNTALHHAAEGDHKEVAALLLSSGAHASSRSNRGFTPLISACEKGRVSVLRVLLEHSGSQGLEDKDKKGLTALHWAAREGHEETAAFLLDQGADATATDNYGHTPLMLACQRRQKCPLGVVRVLVQHMGEQGLEMREGEAMTALHLAASRGHAETVAFLLSKGARADVRSYREDTPLLSACSDGHMDVVAVLVLHMGQEGLEETNEGGETALHYAASGGHEKLVEFLLSHGADANSRSTAGTTPLMTACDGGHVGAVRVFLKHMEGQGLHDTDVRGLTALHWAAGCCYGEVVRLLLLAGADPTIEDTKGRTARALAERVTSWPEEMRAECIAAFQWWEGELERRYALSKATYLQKAYATRRDQPTCGVPTYLEARLPRVEVVSLQSLWRQKKDQAGASDKRKTAGKGGSPQRADVGEKERRAVLSYVVNGLDEELLTQLLEGFHSQK